MLMTTLLMLMACDGGEQPEAAPAPAPAPVAAPAPAPEPAPEAHAEPPDHWPVGVPPNASGLYIIENVNGDEPPPAWLNFETFHGDYGSLPGAKASSVLAAQGSSSYGAANLHDDDYRTAWVEGKAGVGKGEWIEFTFAPGDEHWTCGSLNIVNGYQKSEKSFRENGRVKSFDIVVGGKKVGVMNLADQVGEQIFKVPVNIGDTVRLVITDTYPGSKYEDTAITEMWVACGP